MNCSQCNLEKKIYYKTKTICRKCYRKNIKLNLYAPKKIKKIPNDLNEDQKNLIIGSLLGDGWISPKNKQSYFRINRSKKDIEYLQYEFNIIKDFTNKDIKHYITKKGYNLVSFFTLSSKIFSKYRDEWYINGIKKIPKNLQLNNQIIAIWFCDDGCFVQNKKQYYLDLATNGFSKEDTLLLIDKLNNFFDCNFFKLKKHDLKSNGDYGYKICTNHKGSLFFYEKIKKYIPISMSRKLINIEAASKSY